MGLTLLLWGWRHCYGFDPPQLWGQTQRYGSVPLLWV